MTGSLPRRRERTVEEQKRLIEGWKDPEVLIGDLKTRFRLTWHDVAELKREHGEKARPAPMAPWWRQDRTRRARRGWA